MDFDEIKQILEMMREHELVEFELERGDLKIRLRKQSSGGTWVTPAPAPATAVAPPPAPPAAAAATSSPAVLSPADDEMEMAVVKSPIVGTFYRSPEPG